MSDEYSVDAKYKRDNLIDEHERYRKALERIAAPLPPGLEADALLWELFNRIDIARETRNPLDRARDAAERLGKIAL